MDSVDIYVFESLNQKIMYVKDINLFFEIKSDMLPGRYEYSNEEFLTIVNDTEPDLMDGIKYFEGIIFSSLFDKKEEEKNVKHSEYTLCLNLSEHCNLSCKYCLKDEEHNEHNVFTELDTITFETAKAALEFFVYDFGKNASRYVLDLNGFSGSLMNFGLLKQIAGYCEMLRNETGKNIIIMLTTNATLLTKEHVAYIDNDPFILPGIRIDGYKAANDTNRIYSDGNGTYDDVIKGLSLFKNKKVRLAATITPLNMDVDKTYQHLYSLPNVENVNMNYLKLYNGSEYDFFNFDINCLIKGYENICKSIFRDLDNDDIGSLINLVKAADMFGNYVVMTFSKYMITHYRCDAGRSRIVVNKNGDIYACPEMMGDSSFYIGNVKTGIDTCKEKKFWDTTIQNKCHACFASPVCGGECYAVSYRKFGTYHDQYEKKCELKRALIKLAMGFSTKLKKEYYEKYKELYRFLVVEVGRFSTSDAGIWAILHLLKSDDMKITYSKVFNDINKDAYGVHPRNMLAYLHPYYENINAFQIESPESYKDLKVFPALSYLNKQEKPEHDYAMILGMQNDHLLIKVMTETDVFEVPISEYHYGFSDIVISKSG